MGKNEYSDNVKKVKMGVLLVFQLLPLDGAVYQMCFHEHFHRRYNLSPPSSVVEKVFTSIFQVATPQYENTFLKFHSKNTSYAEGSLDNVFYWLLSVCCH